VPRIDKTKDLEEEVERKRRQCRQQLRFKCDTMRTTLIFRPGMSKKTRITMYDIRRRMSVQKHFVNL
jgi:hypothetical protein